MANIAYIVLNENLDISKQKAMFSKYNIDKYFIETFSDKAKDCAALKDMLEYCHEEDVVIVESIKKFAHSISHLIKLINQLNEIGVQFVSLEEKQFNTLTENGELVFSIFKALAVFERDVVKSRQAKGIAIAKINGVYKGRKKKSIDHNEFLSLYDRWQNKEITKEYMRSTLNVSLSTLDRRIAELRKTKA